MRRTISLFLVLMLSASTGSSLFGQRPGKVRERRVAEPLETPKKKQSKPDASGEAAKFAKAEAFFNRGVWIHWETEVERNNLGFYVYRLDERGENVVSEFIGGAGFTYGDAPVYEQHYSFFDADGTADSAYFVESMTASGRTVRSDAFVPQPVKSVPIIDGMGVLDRGPAAGENSRPVKSVLSLPRDLKAEIASYPVSADPERHRQVLAMPGAKINSKGAGLIRVTRAQLQAAGFDVNSDPNLWQLYLEGVERPIMIGPNADFIEFFGKELDTVESDLRTFYLVVGITAGKRFRSVQARPNQGTARSPRYNQSVTRKERTFFVNQIQNGDLENYWGRVVGASVTTFPLLLTGVDQTPGDRYIRIDLHGYSLTAHNVEITLNGNVLTPITGNGRTPLFSEYLVPVSYLVEGTNALAMRSNGASGDISLFDRVTVDYPRNYKAENDRLDFYTENYRRAVLSGFTSANVRVFDVTNELEPTQLTGLQIVQNGATFGPEIPAARGRLFYAAAESAFSLPISVVANDPEMLGVPNQHGQFLVITHDSLLTQAQTWAAYRAGLGANTKVVEVSNIYDEYNYGTSSSQSIQDFLNYAKNNWQTPPQYVLLIGDASYDPRNYTNAGYWNMVPSRMVNTLYEETGSDEALADFNNDGLAEIPIGRIASRDAAGVTAVFDKTVAWETSLTATSLDRGATFVYDWPDGYDFEAMSNRVMAELPASVPKITISQTSPTAKTDLINAFNEIDPNNAANSGQFVVNYTGHGTSGAWRNTALFWTGDVPSLTNAARPSLITSLTCLNAYFIIASGNESFAEVLTKSPNGGAVAIWASTGRTTPDVQEVMAARFYQQLSAGNIPRLGDLIADAKAQLSGGVDVRRSWAIIGDPMLKVR